MKNIMIIGGMGPQASLLLHRRVIEGAVRNGATEGSDFPQITHISLSIEEFFADTRKMSRAVSTIRKQLGYLWRYSFRSYGYCL